MTAFLSRRRAATGIGLVLVFVVMLVLGWIFQPDAFFRGYWFGLMFWVQLSIGSLIVLLLQDLTGGEWGRAGSPVLRASTSGLFFLLPLFLPVFFALPHIFSWTKIEVGVSSPELVHKQLWLNPTAFTLRSLFYLGAFGLLAVLRCRPVLSFPSGPALAVTIVLISFCSVDWMMSLQPTFYSSLYPFLYFAAAMVSTFALLAGTMAALQMKQRLPAEPELLLAYGKLLFAAVLFWGYIVFSQFIIIWTGNLPDEAEWYVVRSEPTWLWLTLLMIVGHFVVPFCILLSHEIKKNARRLLTICAGLLVMHLLEVFWMMRPTPGEGLRLSVFDFIMPLLIGAGWLWFVSGHEAIRTWLEPLDKEASRGSK